MISAVSRAMAVLELLGSSPHGLGASEIVTRLEIEKSVVSRILATLEKDGYVTRDAATDRVRLGLRLVGAAFRFVESLGFHDFCMPELERLATETGELVQLAVVEHETVAYVAKAEGTQRIRVYSQLGREAALHASTAGKLFLASLPEERALGLALRAGLAPLARNTIRTVDGLRAELDRVRAQGYALLDEELFDGGSAVGMPVHARRDGRVVGSIVVAGPTFRLPRERLLALVPSLRESAARLGLAWPQDLLPPRGAPHAGDRAPAVSAR